MGPVPFVKINLMETLIADSRYFANSTVPTPRATAAAAHRALLAMG